MKYMIIILIIIIISLDQILLSYIACKHITHVRTHARTHACTHARTHARTHTQTHGCTETRTNTYARARHTPPHTPPSPFRLSLFDGLEAHNSNRVNAPFCLFRWRSMAVSCFIQINTHAGGPVSPRFSVFFPIKKIARPNWDANSWQDVLSVDSNSLRHLPRRSSKNCDLQFANCDRQTDRQT